ncbi:MAG TPA: c-type cytochrome [Steroidobacteraceae bacterium]|jgi:cytochrome c oxidase cbb3-type subunit 3|nr:c-type cytochrome [Steroidobacteraceae bacterium]
MTLSPLARTRTHIAVLAIVLGMLVVLGWHLRVRHLEDVLVRADPDRAVSEAGLLNFAMDRAPALYSRHCAGCHGRDMHGSRPRGTPDLSDSVWLFGLGDLPDIENTLDYGVRSGHPKSHNITDMPALGRIGQLSAAELRDVVEYVYAFSHADANPDAVRRGRPLFMDKGSCYDCHGQDGTGNVDYGAPDLTGRSGWLYGGDRRTLFQSVNDGRHGLCPAWITKLSAAQIRELAIFLYTTARRAPHSPTGAAGAT